MEITITFAGGTKVDASVDKYVIHTDQPVNEGGQGTAPEPFVYLLASMGTCAAHYVFKYLESRDLPRESVRLIQKHEWDPKTKKLAKVVQIIELSPDLDEKHHKPIIRSASLCAVKKLFENPPAFDIQTQVPSAPKAP
jgi:ribosomal protein S12 methylthiotransferase accessory factor